MFTDFVLNGQGHGEVGDILSNQVRFDPGLLRPFIDRRGKKCVMVNTGQMKYNEKSKQQEPDMRKMALNDAMDFGFNPNLVGNATSLRKDDWIMLDRAVLRAARARLRAWTDLESASSFGGFNGMAKTLLEHETMPDVGEAKVDMDGITEGRTDAPPFQIEGLPLPITHSSFYFSSRRLAVSRNSGTPLDTTMAEQAGRKVAEQIERSVIGNVTAFPYGPQTGTYGRAPKVYGYTTHPARNTKTDMTVPTGSNGNTTVSEVLGMIKTLNDDNFFGPFMCYHSTDWAQYMDQDYSTSKGDNTLRDRLRKIEQISDVRQLDFLTSTFTIILVQMTSDVARAVNGMEMTTVQWETRGGMQINFKVMAIKVPQIRANYGTAANCGIMHGTTA